MILVKAMMPWDVGDVSSCSCTRASPWESNDNTCGNAESSGSGSSSANYKIYVYIYIYINEKHKKQRSRIGTARSVRYSRALKSWTTSRSHRSSHDAEERDKRTRGRQITITPKKNKKGNKEKETENKDELDRKYKIKRLINCIG